MRDFRIRRENQDRILQKLREKGYLAEISNCAPKTNWNNGCSNPTCCQQHPEAIVLGHYAVMPDTWIAIKTNCSSNALHRMLYEDTENPQTN